MPYEYSAVGLELRAAVADFMDEYIYPNETTFVGQQAEVGVAGTPALLGELQDEARRRGLWNLFLPDLDEDEPGTRLSNLDYAPISELLGRVDFASRVLNCSAPDTGNMELLHRYATPGVRERWLAPLLEGKIRSAFSMTEPDVASSDAANVALRAERVGACFVLNGRKWFSSGASSDQCEVFIVMAKSSPEASRHSQHTMIVVPRDTPGISIGFEPTIFGYEDSGGHPEVVYDNVRVPVENLLGEEGSGFALAQARLGPGRIHHCMRTIGLAERALEMMIDRSLACVVFGSTLSEKGVIQSWIAEARIEIDMCREYVLRTAHLMDVEGTKAAAIEISGIKVAVPRMALRVIDHAIQVHGAAGVSQRTPLAWMYAHVRTLCIADGPDEVHKMSIAKREINRRTQAVDAADKRKWGALT